MVPLSPYPVISIVYGCLNLHIDFMVDHYFSSLPPPSSSFPFQNMNYRYVCVYFHFFSCYLWIMNMRPMLSPMGFMGPHVWIRRPTRSTYHLTRWLWLGRNRSPHETFLQLRSEERPHKKDSRAWNFSSPSFMFFCPLFRVRILTGNVWIIRLLPLNIADLISSIEWTETRLGFDVVYAPNKVRSRRVEGYFHRVYLRRTLKTINLESPNDDLTDRA